MPTLSIASMSLITTAPVAPRVRLVKHLNPPKRLKVPVALNVCVKTVGVLVSTRYPGPAALAKDPVRSSRRVLNRVLVG